MVDNREEKLLSTKKKVFKHIWDYRGFRIEKINRGERTWIITMVSPNYKNLKGETFKSLKKACLYIDNILGELDVKIKPKPKEKKEVIKLNINNIFLNRNTNGKADNDLYNKLREDCILHWLKNEFVENSETEYQLAESLHQELIKQDIVNILEAKKIAGLQQRDFEITYIDSNLNKLTKYIEFKSTQTKNPNNKNMLYQKYTNKSNYIDDGKEQNYTKLFYDKYVPLLKEYYNIKDDITYDEYVKFVYTTGKNKNTPRFFTELKRKQLKDKYDKYKNKKDSYCNTLSKESINEFLNDYEKDLSIENVEKDLNSAIIDKKDFWLVWSQLNNSFKLSKTYKIKIVDYSLFKGRGDLSNGFVLKCQWIDKNGEIRDNFKVEMRLRWKNHNGVFGIAWQFSQKYS